MAAIFITPRFVANTTNVTGVSFRPTTTSGQPYYEVRVATRTHAVSLRAAITSGEKCAAALQATVFANPRRVVGVEMVRSDAPQRFRLLVHMADASVAQIDDDLTEAEGNRALESIAEHLERAERAYRERTYGAPCRTG